MKNKQINFRISEQDKNYLSDYCYDNKTTITKLFDEFIQSKLNAHIMKNVREINDKDIGHPDLYFTTNGWLDNEDFHFINKNVQLNTIRMNIREFLELNKDKYVVIKSDSLGFSDNEMRVYVQEK